MGPFDQFIQTPVYMVDSAILAWGGTSTYASYRCGGGWVRINKARSQSRGVGGARAIVTNMDTSDRTDVVEGHSREIYSGCSAAPTFSLMLDSGLSLDSGQREMAFLHN